MEMKSIKHTSLNLVYVLNMLPFMSIGNVWLSDLIWGILILAIIFFTFKKIQLSLHAVIPLYSLSLFFLFSLAVHQEFSLVVFGFLIAVSYFLFPFLFDDFYVLKRLIINCHIIQFVAALIGSAMVFIGETNNPFFSVDHFRVIGTFAEPNQLALFSIFSFSLIACMREQVRALLTLYLMTIFMITSSGSDGILFVFIGVYTPYVFYQVSRANFLTGIYLGGVVITILIVGYFFVDDVQMLKLNAINGIVQLLSHGDLALDHARAAQYSALLDFYSFGSALDVLLGSGIYNWPDVVSRYSNSHGELHSHSLYIFAFGEIGLIMGGFYMSVIFYYLVMPHFSHLKYDYFSKLSYFLFAVIFLVVSAFHQTQRLRLAFIIMGLFFAASYFHKKNIHKKSLFEYS